MATSRTFNELVQCVTDVLAEIVADKDEAASDRIRAGSIILDRALGKAVSKQIVEERPLTQLTLQFVEPDGETTEVDLMAVE